MLPTPVSTREKSPRRSWAQVTHHREIKDYPRAQRSAVDTPVNVRCGAGSPASWLSNESKTPTHMLGSLDSRDQPQEEYSTGWDTGPAVGRVWLEWEDRLVRRSRRCFRGGDRTGRSELSCETPNSDNLSAPLMTREETELRRYQLRASEASLHHWGPTAVVFQRAWRQERPRLLLGRSMATAVLILRELADLRSPRVSQVIAFYLTGSPLQ
jgi:hypothetical protein